MLISADTTCGDHNVKIANSSPSVDHFHRSSVGLRGTYRMSFKLFLLICSHSLFPSHTHTHTHSQVDTQSDGALCIWRRPNSLGWLSEKRLWPQIMKCIIGPAFTVKRENMFVYVCLPVCVSLYFWVFCSKAGLRCKEMQFFLQWCKMMHRWWVLDHNFQVITGLGTGWVSELSSAFVNPRSFIS